MVALLTARSKTSPGLIARMSTCGFRGCSAPGTSSLMCGRLFVHSLLIACSLTIMGLNGPAYCDEISLGGVRRARGTIQIENSKYAILVTFDPVHSLPPAVNQKVNLSKGRQYALRMLARHLGATGSTRITVSQMTLVKRVSNRDTLEMLFSVPASAVTLSSISKELKSYVDTDDQKSTHVSGSGTRSSPLQPKTESLVVSSNGPDLLARVPDYLDTINTLVYSWHASLTEYRSLDGTTVFQSADQDSWELLREIAADRLLLAHEKGILSEQLRAHLERFLGEYVKPDTESPETEQVDKAGE